MSYFVKNKKIKEIKSDELLFSYTKNYYLSEALNIIHFLFQFFQLLTLNTKQCIRDFQNIKSKECPDPECTIGSADYIQLLKVSFSREGLLR